MNLLIPFIKLAWLSRDHAAGFVMPPARAERRINLFSATGGDLDTPMSFDKQVVDDVDEVDIAIVGAGIGGLCAGAILNTLYNKKVGIYESHYLPGGCAHAFERRAENGVTFTFDSGPTIVLGCSHEPYNPLQQVLRAVGVDDEVEWIPYDGWGIIEHPKNPLLEKRWKLKVGQNNFEEGPLQMFPSNSSIALDEFNALREVTKPLVVGASTIPAMAMRPGPTSLFPLLRYIPSLLSIIGNGVEVSVGPFGPFMNGVSDPYIYLIHCIMTLFSFCLHYSVSRYSK